jgi:hypothetical protein
MAAAAGLDKCTRHLLQRMQDMTLAITGPFAMAVVGHDSNDILTIASCNASLLTSWRRLVMGA